MKKSISIIMILLLCVILSACSGTKSKMKNSVVTGIAITVKPDTVSNTGLNYIINNQADDEVLTGEWFIERKSNSDWYTIAYADGESEASWNGDGLPVPGHSEKEYTCDWENLYGVLESGEYRIIMYFIFHYKDGGTSGSTSNYIISEFTIK